MHLYAFQANATNKNSYFGIFTLNVVTACSESVKHIILWDYE